MLQAIWGSYFSLVWLWIGMSFLCVRMQEMNRIVGEYVTAIATYPKYRKIHRLI